MNEIAFILRESATKEELEKFRAKEKIRKENMEKRIEKMREDYLSGKFDDIIKEL